jgi:hypothetical protein
MDREFIEKQYVQCILITPLYAMFESDKVFGSFFGRKYKIKVNAMLPSMGICDTCHCTVGNVLKLFASCSVFVLLIPKCYYFGRNPLDTQLAFQTRDT